jgi:hypothetical protein
MLWMVMSFSARGGKGESPRSPAPPFRPSSLPNRPVTCQQPANTTITPVLTMGQPLCPQLDSRYTLIEKSDPYVVSEHLSYHDQSIHVIS